MKIVLSKEFTHNGVSYKELDLNLESLTGSDLISVEKALIAAGENLPPVVESSRIYQCAVAAKALHIPREALMNMPAKDFTNICLQVLLFFGSAGSTQASTESPEK